MGSVPRDAAWTLDKPAGPMFLRPRRVLFAADGISGCIALLVTFAILYLRHSGRGQLGITCLMAGLIVVFTIGLLVRAGQYSGSGRMSPLSDIGVLARDLLIAAAMTTLLSYLTKGFLTGLTSPSRAAVGAFFVTFFLLGVANRFGLRAYQRRQYARGRGLRKILLAGDGEAAADFLRFVGNRPWLGIVVAGRLAYGSPKAASTADLGDQERTAHLQPAGPMPLTHLVDGLEGLKRLDRALRASEAAEVVVALDPEDQAQLPKVAGLLSLAHVPFKVVPSLFEETYRTTELLGYAELPVVDVDVDALDRVNRLSKRTLDVAFAVSALVVLLPLELAILTATAIDSGLPIIYKHERVGKNGRRFTMYKFRTMVKDADDRFKDLRPNNEVGFSEGRIFKMRKDPRVTRVGAILRRLSLDELPQLVNVLRGDMSVVGPRPPLPHEVEKYEREHLYRLKGLPGITGLWQVSGRSDLNFDDMIRLDRYYLDNWSVGLDVSIMLKTFLVMVTGKGAY